MATLHNAEMGGAYASPASSTNLSSLLIRLGGLALIDAITIYLLYNMFSDGVYALAIVLAIVTLSLNVVFLREELYPLRWISPGLAFLIMLVAYPIFSTVYTSLTNYGDGHLLNKTLAIRRLEQERFLNEGASVYEWTAFVKSSEAGDEYLLWLTLPDQNEQLLLRPDAPPETVTGDIPSAIEGYRQINKIERLKHTTNLVNTAFGSGEDIFRVSDKQLGKAAKFQQRYRYDPAQDRVTDQQLGTDYHPVDGTFTADNGETLRPGYRVYIGPQNFVRLFTSPALRQPFLKVFLWTILYAICSVVITFALGLFLAIIFNVPDMPLQRITRSLLLIPYAIPAFISVPIWVGLLNPQFGIVSQAIFAIFGFTVPWFSHPIWSKMGILLIQLWLGFPYMFVICTGALQALPTDVYEAADIDGANPWQKFKVITLPLLLITVGPLLVASFAYNFNNFTLIELYNEGKPPMSGTLSPVGETDILVTYTYSIAFDSGRGADLGYAAAMTVVLFVILTTMVYFQFRFTDRLEEASENV